MMPTDDPLGQANWRRCVNDYETDKRAQDARDAQQAQDARDAQLAEESQQLEKKPVARNASARSAEEARRPRLNGTAARWRIEIEESLLESNSTSPDYPNLAWLNGLWCGPEDQLHKNAFRWQVVSPNRLRHVHYSFRPVNNVMNTPEKHFLEETLYSIEEKEGYFEIALQLNRSVPSSTMYYNIRHIKMESDSTYSQLYAALVSRKTDEVEIELDPVPAMLERCDIQ